LRPTRERKRQVGQTYFVTSQTWQRRTLFRNPEWAELFLHTLVSYRNRAYVLHEYVLMPEHFHILISPLVSLERAVQFVKGGFSFRAEKELGSGLEIWQAGFSDHRVRSERDFQSHVRYIYNNPVTRGLVQDASQYPYCSAFPGSPKDEVPQWLKPNITKLELYGAAKAVPLQSEQILP